MKRLSVGLLLAACACAAQPEPLVMNACDSNNDCPTGFCMSGFCAPTPAEPTISVHPAAAATQAGGPSVEFRSSIRNGSGEITWTLNGPGSIVVTTSGVAYTPPLEAATLLNATVTASSGTLSATALVSVNPKQGGDLELTPSIASARGGGAPITFTLTGGGSLSIPDWTLVGPGSLSNTNGRQTIYLPPAILDTKAEAVLTATVPGQALASTAKVFLEPAPATLQVEVMAPTMTSVFVVGPDSYATSVPTGVTTLSGLAPGNYTVTPGRSRFAGAYIDSWWEASATQVTLGAGATVRLPIGYIQRKSTGTLWAPSIAEQRVVAFADEQLAAAPSEPRIGIGLPSDAATVALAFAPDGTLWTLDINGTLRHFTIAQLSQSGRPAPDVTIRLTGTGVSTTLGLAFDLDGTLWVSTYGGRLVGVPPSLLGTSGTINATSPLTTSAGSARHFHGLALDSSGQLWASDYGTNSLVAFSRTSLRLGGLQTPSVIITSTAWAFDTPGGLAFDNQQSLWIANSGASAVGGVVRFASADLVVSGAPAPSVVLNVGSPPYDVAFDQAGNLWTIDGTFALKRFASSAVVVSGTPSAQWVRQLGFQSLDLAFNLPVQ